MKRCLTLVLIMTAALPLLSAEGDRKEIVIPAEAFAPPESTNERPTADRWWLRKDAKDWGIDRPILMTGAPNGKPIKQGEWVVPAADRFVPYRVPELVIDPKMKGWCR